MTEQDNIRNLFSKGLESHTTPVRPEVWQGLQAKMAAAGVASGSAATAVKGISALTKWIIGGAAATAVVVTTVVLTNDTKNETQKDKEQTVAFNPSITNNDSAQQTITSEEVQRENPVVSGGNSISSDVRITENPQRNFDRQTLPDSWGPVLTTGTPVSNNQDNSHPPATIPVAVPNVTPAETPKAEQKPTPATYTTPAPEPKTDTKPVSRSKIGEVPNVFTSGANNRFSVESKYVTDFSITIMNNRGVPVFRSSDPAFVWDGKMLNGEDAPAGAYSCIIIARGENGELLKEHKPLEVVR